MSKMMSTLMPTNHKSNEFGCVTRDPFLCFANSSNASGQQCTCIAFDPWRDMYNEMNIKINSQSYSAGADDQWQCGGCKTLPMLPYSQEGAAACSADCQSSSDHDCKIEWTDWSCDETRNNQRQRQGTLQQRRGKRGKNCEIVYKENGPVQCGWSKCKQEPRDFSEACPPERRATKSNCRCELDWHRFHNPFSSTDSEEINLNVCGEKFQGCCSVGGNSHTGSSAVCLVGQHPWKWPQPQNCDFTANDEKTFGKSFHECDAVAKDNGHVCHPWWYLEESSKCPYGYALPGDVTLPHATGSRKIFVYVSVIYGFVPYLVAFIVLVEFLCQRGVKSLSFLSFVLLSCLLGEFFFKRLVNSPRPEYSCLHSCGMPSSHSTLAVGYLTLMFLDATWRIWPESRSTELSEEPLRNSRETFAERAPSLHRSNCQENITSHFEDSTGETCCYWYSAVPMMSFEETPSFQRFARWMGFWFCILIPVPITRILLNDHTASQVLTGCVIGVSEAVAWFQLLRHCIVKKRTWLIPLGLKQDYLLPEREPTRIGMQVEMVAAHGPGLSRSVSWSPSSPRSSFT
eukprot:gnl/MRDRNA2_/MRDRNA2_53527_c0_seq1.p1 gnl/MRDRNA2_/MRDRNA2_53527_c0~~gnl/MRDRNA2_/MRDRNA2_53527_c0_seq1.p1  ORF type:complete len:662 (+),score=57.97 gnl/MRDRNA2_/MRDRNA2_53527_c0_seq1:275-1987(+)